MWSQNFKLLIFHIMLFVFGSYMVLETSQQMTDIPYGDYFQVQVYSKSFWRVYSNHNIDITKYLKFASKEALNGSLAKQNDQFPTCSIAALKCCQ